MDGLPEAAQLSFASGAAKCGWRSSEAVRSFRRRSGEPARRRMGIWLCDAGAMDALAEHLAERYAVIVAGIVTSMTLPVARTMSNAAGVRTPSITLGNGDAL